jgi:hypothetical protein
MATGPSSTSRLNATDVQSPQRLTRSTVQQQTEHIALSPGRLLTRGHATNVSKSPETVAHRFKSKTRGQPSPGSKSVPPLACDGLIPAAELTTRIRTFSYLCLCAHASAYRNIVTCSCAATGAIYHRDTIAQAISYDLSCFSVLLQVP